MKDQRKYQAVSKLSSRDRYLYFIRKVADFQQVYIWFKAVSSGGESDQNPNRWMLFPELIFAEGYLKHTSDSSEITLMDLHDFLANTIPGVNLNTHSFEIFPSSDSIGMVVSGLVLKQDLLDELEQYL